MRRCDFFSRIAGVVFIAAFSSAQAVAAPLNGSYAAGDESAAVRVAVSVLSQGGSAADAAAAMYFALAVTYPVAAGLGGGGLCIVHDGATGANESFDFLPHTAAGGGLYAVPGAVRGFALIQAVYGRLPWARAVGPAEALAATGFAISQPLAIRLTESLRRVRLDPALSAEFLDLSTNVKKPGTMVTNAGLSQTLAAIPEHGANGFYLGDVAQKIADASTAQTGKIGLSELNTYAVKREAASAASIGSDAVYVVPARLGAGAFANAMLAQFTGQVALPENLPAAIATATKQTLEKFAIASLPMDMGATGFMTADSSGQAVACGVTMNGPFGSGHTVPETGVTLAGAPSSQAGLSSAFLTPVIVTDSGGGLAMAGTGSGGPNGTASIVHALLRSATGVQINALRSTGLTPYSTVNAVICQSESCTAMSDPGGSGLAVSQGR